MEPIKTILGRLNKRLDDRRSPKLCPVDGAIGRFRVIQEGEVAVDNCPIITLDKSDKCPVVCPLRKEDETCTQFTSSGGYKNIRA